MNEIIAFQIAFVDMLNPDKPIFLDYVFLFISLFGDWKVLAVASALAYMWRREHGRKLVLLLIVTLALLAPFKLLVHEPRPPLVSDEIRSIGGEADMKSFPSGHTTLAFAYAAMLSQVFNRGWSIYLYTFALLIAVSRIYLGMHYPLDVAAGAGLGLISARLTKFLYSRIDETAWSP